MRGLVHYLAIEGRDAIVAEVMVMQGLVIALFASADGTRVGKHNKLDDGVDLCELAENCERDLIESGLTVQRSEGA